MHKIEKTALDGVVIITPKRFGDHRGFFSETYNQHMFDEAGIRETFVQDNHSFSKEKGVLRGLHYQLEPHAQAKLVRVTRGRVFDVAVDIRKGSPTFAKWVGVELSAENWQQLYIPAGFAHGFLTLEENCEFLYKVTNFYQPSCDRSIRFDDSDISIDWPLDSSTFVLSDKDLKAPYLKEADTFYYKDE